MEHPHKLCCLRQELVDAFAESRYMTFIKLAAYHLQTMGLNKKLNGESAGQSSNQEKSEAEETKVKDEKVETETKESKEKVFTENNNASTEKSDGMP